MPDVETDLALARQLADLADGISLPRSRAHDLHVESKPDLSPVTDADLAVEAALRERLAVERPEDAVLGEEFGYGGTEVLGRRWIIDPIDGTKNFMRGAPVWATLIALAEGDEVLVGVVSAPALGRRWSAARGRGAWLHDDAGSRRLRVSAVERLADASLSYSSLSGWQERGLRDSFIDLTDRLWRTRAYGDFWSYMLVAEGAVDCAAEPELALHDMAALVPIVEEAGGRFTDLAGVPGPWGADALASNGLLHTEIVEALH